MGIFTPEKKNQEKWLRPLRKKYACYAPDDPFYIIT